MKNKKVFFLAALLLTAAFSAGRYTAPSKIVKKVVTVEKVVEVEKKNVQIVVKEVKRPDGTIEKETKTIDLSVTERQEDTRKESKKVVQSAKPQWRVGAGVGLQDGIRGVVYTGRIERRVLGPVFAGLDVGPQQRYVGLSLSMEF